MTSPHQTTGKGGEKEEHVFHGLVRAHEKVTIAKGKEKVSRSTFRMLSSLRVM
jgi:hypothetical protein